MNVSSWNSWIKRKSSFGVRLFWCFCLVFLPAPANADILEIPGTGACQVLLRAVAAAFNDQHPGHQVIVPHSVGSNGGIRQVVKDQALLARVARPLKEREKAEGLRYLVFARDMVVFAGGVKVNVRNLTASQLVEVYSGKIADWQELGGNPAPIRLLVREPGDSSLLIIQEHLPAFRTISFPQNIKVIHTDPKMLATIQKYQYSLGWLTYSSLRRANLAILPLALDGIAPTPDNARTHKYRLIGDYALVFKETRLNDLARSFLDFIFSPDCRHLMEQYGVIPVNKD